MNEKAVLIGILTLATFLSGCGASHSHEQVAVESGESHHEHGGSHDGPHSSHGVEFKEGEGLSIPATTRELLGLKIFDVEEGKAIRRIELSLRVFKVDHDTLLASGPADTNLAAFLQPGRNVSLVLKSESSRHGEIVSIEPNTAKFTGMAEVVVRVPRVEGLEIGSFLDGFVTITTSEDVVLIPKGSLLKTAEGYFAYVVNGNSLFRTKISVGGQEGEKVEVMDGLYTGDRVVLQPIMSLWLAELQAIRGGQACADGH
jgi:hypothetical protein